MQTHKIKAKERRQLIKISNYEQWIFDVPFSSQFIRSDTHQISCIRFAFRL